MQVYKELPTPLAVQSSEDSVDACRSGFRYDNPKDRRMTPTTVGSHSIHTLHIHETPACILQLADAEAKQLPPASSAPNNVATTQI